MAADRDIFVDVFGEIVQAVRDEYDPTNDLEPYYMYGHPREVAKTLSLLDQSAVDKFRKFPLIYLVTDIEQQHGEFKDVSYELNFTVLIITSTDKTYTSEERTENTFKPTLYPIYNLLLEKMQSSRAIAKTSTTITHTHTDKYGWGNSTVYGSEGLIFNEYLDAMEINFTNISVYKELNQCQ